MNRRIYRLALCLVLLTGLVGCSATSGPGQGDGGGRPAADSAVFAGLDATVVAEVLSNPVAVEQITNQPQDSIESTAQGVARNFIVCRAFWQAYKTWTETGVKPPDPPAPRPDNPAEPSNSGWVHEFGFFLDAYHLSEPESLRTQLTGNGSCGQWIPARPGDVNGPTIADEMGVARWD